MSIGKQALLPSGTEVGVTVGVLLGNVGNAVIAVVFIGFASLALASTLIDLMALHH